MQKGKWLITTTSCLPLEVNKRFNQLNQCLCLERWPSSCVLANNLKMMFIVLSDIYGRTDFVCLKQ